MKIKVKTNITNEQLIQLIAKYSGSLKDAERIELKYNEVLKEYQLWIWKESETVLLAMKKEVKENE